jgi:DNA-binding CsgD family transcriptional regulator
MRVLVRGNEGVQKPPEFWRSVRGFLPCNYPDRTGDLISVVRWSDFYTQRELRNAPHYVNHLGPNGDRHGMHIAFPCPPGQMRKISFWRTVGPDFSERDRLVAELIRPHLWEIYLDSQRRRRVPQLSRREWEVLRLVDQGYSNAEVAKLLHISIATVRKHMEHIFDRTGTRSRSSAAALMMSRRHPEPVRPPT